MKMNRRRFCQLTLATTLASTLPVLGSESATLRPHYNLKLQNGYVDVSLVVENLGAEPNEILVRRGYTDGIEVSIRSKTKKDWTTLESVNNIRLSEHPMSRAGPRPLWSQIAPGQRQDFGIFRAPYGGSQTAELSLKLHTRDGTVEFPPESVTISS